MEEKERVFDQCKDCIYLKELRSHPWVDKKPCSNIDGYVCIMEMAVFDSNYVGKCSNSIGCEMFESKEKYDLMFSIVKKEIK